MANTKSAKKALRQTRTRSKRNLVTKFKIKSLVREIKTDKLDPDILKEQCSKLQGLLDKAAKSNVIHKNKAARLKRRLLGSAHGERKQDSGKTLDIKPKSKPNKRRN